VTTHILTHQAHPGSFQEYCSGTSSMEHWMMNNAALALGISPEANTFFRLYALFIFSCIFLSSVHVLHLSGIASLLKHQKSISFSVGYLFDVMARSARVFSYIIMHILSYRYFLNIFVAQFF